MFEPYNEILDPNEDARQAIRDLIERARAGRKMMFLFLNNRFEGSAPATIRAIVEGIHLDPPPFTPTPK